MFLVGAFCAGLAAPRLTRPGLTRGGGDRSRLLLVAIATEVCFVAAAALVAFVEASVATGWPRYLVIALLAFPMGVRNATVRRLAVPDLTTTVLTMTLTGLAADAAVPGGEHAATVYRRVAAVLAMLAGATAGASASLHKGPALPLLIAALVVAVTGTAFGLSQRRGATMVA